MKVQLDRKYREKYTLDELDQAKRVISYEKENDDSTIESWAEYAITEALKEKGGYLYKTITATATTAKNNRVWNAYGDDDEATGRMDVWIKALGETDFGYIKVGAYLSDIWMAGAVDFREHMYIQRYLKEQ